MTGLESGGGVCLEEEGVVVCHAPCGVATRELASPQNSVSHAPLALPPRVANWWISKDFVRGGSPTLQCFSSASCLVFSAQKREKSMIFDRFPGQRGGRLIPGARAGSAVAAA